MNKQDNPKKRKSGLASIKEFETKRNDAIMLHKMFNILTKD